jgi:hypothetical protein
MFGKKVLFVFLFVFFMAGIVSAVQIDVKNQVEKGENFIVKVSGNFVSPPTASQVKFYREGHINTAFGTINIEKIEGDYYFYLSIPLEKLADNYTMVLENVQYYTTTGTVTGNIEANFTILNKTVPFTINPPLIVAHDSYSVDVQNLMDQGITIDLGKDNLTAQVYNDSSTTSTTKKISFFESLFGTSTTDANTTTTDATPSSTVSLMSGEVKTLNFMAPATEGFEKLQLYYNGVSYSALVYNPYDRTTSTTTTTNETNTTNATSQNGTISINETTNVTINETGNVTLNQTDNNSILNQPNVTVTENGTIINKTTNKTIGSTVLNCADLNGTKCDWNGGETCSSSTYNAADGACCLDTCQQPKKSNTGKIVGWSIIIIIVLFATWFFKKKYQRAGPKKIDLVSMAGPKK